MADPEKLLDELNFDIRRENIVNAECVDCVRVGMLEEIADAVRAQIPVTVVKTTSTIRCRKCGKQLTSIGALHTDFSFCKWCGQAINWGNVPKGVKEEEKGGT